MKNKAGMNMSRSCVRRGPAWWASVACVFFCAQAARAVTGQSVTLINDLDAPSPQPPLINNVPIWPGTGYGVGFSNGATAYSLNSVTLQFVSGPAPGLHLMIYSFTPAGTIHAIGDTNTQFTPVGELGNPVASPEPTPWPGQTAFVTYTPLTSISLDPNSDYLVGVTEDLTGSGANQLVFTTDFPNYNTAGGVQMFGGSAFPPVYQWVYGQPPPGASSNLWSTSPREGFILALDATPTPEPSVPALLIMGGLGLFVRLGRNRWKAL